MNVIEQFRNDLWNGIWLHAKRLFKPMSIVALISFIISMGLMFFVFSKILGMDGFQSMTDPANMFDMDAMQERNMAMLEYFQGIGIGKVIGLAILTYMIGILVTAWVINFLLIISHQLINEEGLNIGKAFSESFSSDVFKLFALTLIVLVVYIGLAFVSMMLAALHFIVVFIAIMFTMAFLCRFGAAYPAIVHGKMSLSEAISFSMKNITWGRGFKIILVLIVFGIVYVLALLLISSLLGFIGTVGSVLSMVVQIGMSIVVYSLSVSALSAMFYRYVEVEYVDADAVEQHIIDTEE
jgi:hypothetical protein